MDIEKNKGIMLFREQNPRTEYLKQKERKKYDTMLHLTLLISFTTLLFEVLTKEGLCSVIIEFSYVHLSFILLFIIKHHYGYLNFQCFSMDGLVVFRFTQLLLFYSLKCYANMGEHYEYIMMVLYVHSTIVKGGTEICSLLFVFLFVLVFVYFRSLSYIYDYGGKSIDWLQRLNHLIFFLAPFGVHTFSRMNETLLKHLNNVSLVMSSARAVQIGFIKKFAHCCRTHLNGINIFQYQLFSENGNPNSVDSLNLFEESSSQTLTLVNDLVDFHELKVKHIQLTETSGNLRETVLKSLSFVESRHLKKSVKFIIDIDDELPDHIKFDKHRLIQITTNLVSNALKYTDEGIVSVRAYMDPLPNRKDMKMDDPDLLRRRRFHFIVKDTGIGVPKEKLKDVFTPFSSVNRTSKPSLGLGLVISKEIVDLMKGGRISLESEGVGMGVTSSFSCILDLSTPEEIKQEKSARSSANSSIPSTPGTPRPEDDNKTSDVTNIIRRIRKTEEEKKKFRDLSVLVVEDVSTNREVMGICLDKFGVGTVDFAENGSIALSCINAKLLQDDKKNASITKPSPPYDVILMDINMPVMDGKACTERIRRVWSEEELPVYAVTAKVFSQSAGRELFRKMGFNGYCRKPFGPDEIRRLMKLAIKKKSEIKLRLKNNKILRKKKNEQISKEEEEGEDEDEEDMKKVFNILDLAINATKNKNLEGTNKQDEDSNEVNALQEEKKHGLVRYIQLVLSVVHLSSIFCLCLFLLFFSTEEVSQRSWIIAVLTGLIYCFGKYIGSALISKVLTPLSLSLLIQLFLGDDIYSSRLYFVAMFVKVFYHDAKELSKVYLIFCWALIGSLEIFRITHVTKYILPPLSEISTKHLETSNAFFEFLYVTQIVTNMVYLVISKKEREKALLEAIQIIESDTIFQSNFAAKISHDLRSPIFACEFLLKKMKDDFIDPINNTSSRNYRGVFKCLGDLRRETDNLVDFYRLGNNKISFNNISYPLRETLDSMWTDFISVFEIGEIECEEEIGEASYDTLKRRKFSICDCGHLSSPTKDVSTTRKFRYDVEKGKVISPSNSTKRKEIKDEESKKKLFFVVECEQPQNDPFPKLAIFDRERLEKIMNNLVSNALSYTLSGEISVRYRFIRDGQGGTGVESFGKSGLFVSVEDSGCGIASDKVGRMFNSDFYFMENLNSLGIGLNVCREALRCIGGNLQIKSEVGKGTKVSIFYPMEETIENQELEEESEEEEIEGEECEDCEDEKVCVLGLGDGLRKQKEKSGRRVSISPSPISSVPTASPKRQKDFSQLHPLQLCVVEDNEISMKMMKFYFSTMLGYDEGNIRYCMNGREAIEAMTNAERIDLCFIDYYLPDVTAIELIPQLKEVSDSYTQYILCSGTLVAEHEKKLFMQLCPKPVRLDNIKNVIERFSKKKRKKGKGIKKNKVTVV